MFSVSLNADFLSCDEAVPLVVKMLEGGIPVLQISTFKKRPFGEGYHYKLPCCAPLGIRV